MQKLSQVAIWLRGVLYVGAAVVTFLLGDSNFRSMVTPQVLTVMGAAGVALLTIRSYIDGSVTRGNPAAVEPTPVVTLPDEPLEVKPVSEAKP
jgi:hypothetical protein